MNNHHEGFKTVEDAKEFIFGGAATFTVIVTDQGTAGCTADTTITVTTTAGITAVATLIRDALCTNSLDGMAYATPVGGAPVYTYAWNDGAGVVSTDSVEISEISKEHGAEVHLYDHLN